MLHWKEKNIFEMFDSLWRIRSPEHASNKAEIETRANWNIREILREKKAASDSYMEK